MSSKNIWNEYCKETTLGSGTYSFVYKAKNIKTGNYVAIKEIDKSKYKQKSKSYFEEMEIMNKLNSENSISFIETIETKEYFI